jgi:hypothetical protein
MRKPRKQFRAEEKAAILRRHLLELEPVSKLGDELGLQPAAVLRTAKSCTMEQAAACGRGGGPCTFPTAI